MYNFGTVTLRNTNVQNSLKTNCMLYMYSLKSPYTLFKDLTCVGSIHYLDNLPGLSSGKREGQRSLNLCNTR